MRGWLSNNISTELTQIHRGSLSVLEQEKYQELSLRVREGKRGISEQRIWIVSIQKQFEKIVDAREMSEEIILFSEKSTALKVPPAAAEILVTLFSRRVDREILLGDLEQDFLRHQKNLGAKRARRIYWIDTVHILGGLLWPAAKRWGIAALAVAGLKKWIGL